MVRSKMPLDDELALMRQRIDDCDHELLAVLARRMTVAREIGNFKRDHNMRVVQPQRYQEMMDARLIEAAHLGLETDFTRRVMQAIHEESVRQQINIQSP